MNIAFLHPDLGIGGAERFVVDAARVLQARGHRVTIFTAQHHPQRSFDDTRDGQLDIRVHGRWLPAQIGGRLRAPCAIARMSTLARAATRGPQAFDVLCCDLVAHVIPLVRRLGRAPVVFYCHYPDLLLAPHDSRWRRLYRAPIDRLEAHATDRADRVLVNSAFTASVLRRTFLALRVNPIVLSPGVDAAPLTNAVPSPPSASHSVLTLGRFAPDKNLPLALDAYAALRERLPADTFRATRLLIAGGYDDRLRECRAVAADLERTAQTYGLAEQVRFVRSPSDAQRAELLTTCRCVLHPSVEEHFGYVPIEAMAAGRPVLAADRGGPTETVVDGETGFLRPAQPEAFAGALHRLMSDPASADRLGAAGRRRVAAHFSLEAFGAQLEQILISVAARS